MIFGPKTLQNSKFFNQLNVFPMSPVFVTTPFLVQKALKTANSEKFVFLCQTSKWCPSLQVRSFSAENRLHAFAVLRIPPKACEFQAAEPVAACHRFVTTRFLGAKVHKTRPSSRAPSPQGFSRPAPVDSPPRWSVSPPSLSPLMSPLHPAPFFCCKKRLKRSSPKSPFFVSGCKWDKPTFAGLRKTKTKENKGSQKKGSRKKKRKGGAKLQRISRSHYFAASRLHAAF